MFDQQTIKVIIPAYNEADSIGRVIDAVPDWVDEIIVVDNNSSDQTGKIAAEQGARVIREVRQGYGQACLTGIAALDRCNIVVFLDGDFSDYPEEMDRLVQPVADNLADMVIGARKAKEGLSDALTFPQRFGNSLACFLMQLIWRGCFTDLGPFRAIHNSSLKKLQMADRNYGWTIEMQIKALRAKLRVMEVPVNYRRRIGKSKISGTLRGVMGAGTKILWTIFRQAINPTPIAGEQPEKLIVFSRFPLPGQTKTRLIPALGALKAAWLQRQLTEMTLRAIHPFTKQTGIDCEIHYDGHYFRKMRQWLGPDYIYRPQASGDLGRRLANAFRRAFDQGCEKVVIIGTDCPAINDAYLRDAFGALDHHHLVLGPSTDGGYWLIGLNKPANIFENITWGGSEVLASTLQQAEKLRLSYALLDTLTDIDEPQDLDKLPPYFKPHTSYLSVIIPALNEEDHIERAILSVQGSGIEVIVADGGSSDATVERAKQMDVQVIQTQTGRSYQMNQAAKTATGDVLLFLHADTFLKKNTSAGSSTAINQMFSALSNPDVGGGAFTFTTDYPALALALIEAFVNWRSCMLHLPYGDQALFIRKSLFDKLGGFAPLKIGEDIDLVQRMKQQGRLAHLRSQAVTSGRRWRQHGPWKTTLLNQLVLVGLLCGIPDHLLAQWYAR